jgi:hypothetical protein
VQGQEAELLSCSFDEHADGGALRNILETSIRLAKGSLTVTRAPVG